MKNMQSKMIKTIVTEVKSYFVTNGGLLTPQVDKATIPKQFKFHFVTQ